MTGSKTGNVGNKGITIDVPTEAWEKVKERAKSENRTISNFVKHLVMESIKERSNGKES